MPNIYLKVTIEKNWCSQNFDYLSLKIHLQAEINVSINNHFEFNLNMEQ